MKTLLIIESAHGGIYFALTYLAAFLVAAGMMIFQGHKRGYPASAWLLIIVSGVIFFIIGEKVFSWSPGQWNQVFTRFSFPGTDRKTILGGIIGLFTGILLAKALLRFNRPVLDTFAVVLPVSMAISRIGCLMAGCCFGTPTNLPWGIRYDAASHVCQVHQAQGLVQPGAVSSLAVHPAQLYQVIGCLAIAFIVWRSRKHWKAGGSLFLLSVLCYGVLRFFVEFVRDPESSFVLTRVYLGLKAIQWVILGVILPGLLILINRESKAKSIPAVSGSIRVSDIRQVLLAVSIFLLAYSGRKWFGLLELSTIMLFLVPAIVLISVKIYRHHSVAGFRWILPVLMVCCFGFMSQKSNLPLKENEKMTFTDIGIVGMAGRYVEDIYTVSKTSNGCGTVITNLNYAATQKRTFYQGGMDASYNVWKGKYYKYSVGARGFLGFESGGKTTDYPNSNNSFGISPYMSVNWHYIGLGAGVFLGMTKIPINGKPKHDYNANEIVSPEYMNAYALPSLSFRVGPVESLYLETTFPGLFPSSTPYPLFQAGVGSGFGKTDGTRAEIGYCQGIYAKLVLPVKDIVVVQALYADNTERGDHSKRVFSFGVNYRFSFHKTNMDTFRIKPQSEY